MIEYIKDNRIYQITVYLYARSTATSKQGKEIIGFETFCLLTGMEKNGTLTLYYKIVLFTFIWDIWDSVTGRLKKTRED